MDNAMVYMLLLQVIAGDLVPPDDTLWGQLPAIEVLCPGQDVCPEARPLNFSEASDKKGCCAECSCDPSCIDHGNCCFQRMATLQQRSDQECLYETLFPPNYIGEQIKSYYMVTKKPRSGCVANVNSVYSDPCCEAQVAPWGSFLPVWSPSKGRIYKNSMYAECHGINDYIMWDVAQLCTEVKDVASDLDGCNIHFTFPGGTEEIKTEQCFTDLYGTCPDDFAIMPEVQNLTTKKEIRDGCQSDFRLAYHASNHLKNVYCYICMNNPPTMSPEECVQGYSRRPLGQYKFTSVLSGDYLAEYRPHQNKVPDKACEMEDGKVQVGTCRRVYCPTGRTFSAVDGRCTFASQSWNIGRLQIWLYLTFDNPDETLTYGAFQDLVNSGFSVNTKNKWRIWDAYIPLSDSVSPDGDWKADLLKNIHKSTLQRPAKELLLSAYPKGKTGDPSKLMDMIQSSLSEKWTVRLGGTQLDASVRLSNGPFAVLGSIAGIGWIYYPSFMRARDNDGSKIFNESKAYLGVVQSLRMKTLVDILNKLYLCRQIELESHEFVLYSESNPLALRLVGGSKYLGWNEFKLRKKTGGNQTARVCLQDAGYHFFSKTSNARRLQACVFTLLMLAFFC